MAIAPAVPLVEGLGALIARSLAALGVAALAHEAGQALPKDRARDCADAANESQCNQCQLHSGHIATAPRYVTGATRINYDYQLYIANLHAGPERFSYVAYGDASHAPVDIGWGLTKNFFGTGGQYTTTEWAYNGVMFDGFWRALCTVVEAKGNYDQVFNGGSDGRVKPWAREVLSGWSKQLHSQQAAIVPAAPQAKLEWHFMQRLSYERAIRSGLSTAAIRYTPMMLRGA